MSVSKIFFKKQSRVLGSSCVACNMAIAPADREAINVSTGRAHLKCAIAKTIRMLLAVGLPKPLRHSTLYDIRVYLDIQVAALLLRPVSEIEVKLEAISAVCEYLCIEPTASSKLISRARSGEEQS